MEYMEGGAIPVRDEERFRLVFDMINQDKSEIKCVSYSSLNGFIFSVGGEGVTASFKSITKGEGKPEQSGLKKILMKLVVISDKKEKLDNIEISKDGKILNKGDKERGEEFEESVIENKPKENKPTGKPQIKVKQSITEDEFKEETETQIDIFKKTWVFGNLPLCPSVLSYAVIDNVRSRIFMDMLLDKVGDVENIERSILRYLKKQLQDNEGRRIGILCMEYKEKFQTYAEYIKESNTQKMTTDARYILAKMIILLLECGIVHCDLHMNNVLIKPDCKETSVEGPLDKVCYEMIDFGRIEKKNAGIIINKERKESKGSNIEKIEERTRSTAKKHDNTTQQQAKNTIHYNDLDVDQIFRLLQIIYESDLAYKKNINKTLKYPQCAWIFGKAGLFNANVLTENKAIISDIKSIIQKYYDAQRTEITQLGEGEQPTKVRETFDQIFEMKMYKKDVFTSNESEVNGMFTFYGMMLTYYLQKFGEGYKIEQITPSEETGPIYVEISRDSGVGDGGDIKVINSQMDNLNTIMNAMGGSIQFSFVGK